MRILIVRTSALGDIVHGLPTLVALRAKFPDTEIGWVVEESMAPLLEEHPDIDRLIEVATRRWRRAPLSTETRREVGALRRALSDFAPDVALDLMGNHKGAILARLSRAPRRIGLRRRDRREPSSAFWLNEQAPSERPHAVDRSLAVARPLGIDTSRPSFGGERLREDLAGDLPNPPYIVVFPATGWGNKNYPAEPFGEVIAGIANTAAAPILISPGPGEEALAEEIATASGATAAVLPVLPIPRLVALLRRAELAIGGDTGPIHLAHALDTPVVCIMGPTDPAQNGPYNSPESAVVEHLHCSFCYKRYDDAKPCLLGISPTRVVERSLALLRAR